MGMGDLQQHTTLVAQTNSMQFTTLDYPLASDHRPHRPPTFAQRPFQLPSQGPLREGPEQHFQSV